jgi:hypothetical protein
MSTELTPIKGRIEIPDGKTKTSSYKETELLLTSFYGGTENGRMIQLTLPLGICHIQMTQQQVRDLLMTLAEWND